jgi:hypothetical protein
MGDRRGPAVLAMRDFPDAVPLVCKVTRPSTSRLRRYAQDERL